MNIEDLEKEFLFNHLSKDKRMLEWGSGATTSQIRNLVQELISIEHDPRFNDGKVILKIPNDPKWRYGPYGSDEDGSFEQFHDYVLEPLNHGKFDIILIDGRARASCAKICPKLIRNNNVFIFLHDCSRQEYKEVFDLFTLVDRIGGMAKFIIKEN